MGVEHVQDVAGRVLHVGPDDLSRSPLVVLLQALQAAVYQPEHGSPKMNQVQCYLNRPEMVNNAPEGLNKVILRKMKRFDCKTNQVSSKQLASF